MSDTRTVLFANHQGGGFASYHTVEAGTTLADFLRNQLSGPADNYVVRVNGQAAPGDQPLQDKDRVTASPTKIVGA
jgi:sulfur carrier protein ThiS